MTRKLNVELLMMFLTEMHLLAVFCVFHHQIGMHILLKPILWRHNFPK